MFCTPVNLNKHNITFIKLGTNDVNMMTSWCYCFPCYNVFGCFSLKETENLLNIWWKIKINFTRENIAFYDHSWNKFLSYTNIQQISSIYLPLGMGLSFGNKLALKNYSNMTCKLTGTLFCVCFNFLIIIYCKFCFYKQITIYFNINLKRNSGPK